MKNTKHIILTSLMGLLVSTAYAANEADAVVGHAPAGQHAAAQIQNPQMMSWEAIDRLNSPQATAEMRARRDALVAAKIDAEEHGIAGIAGMSWEAIDRVAGPQATAEMRARHEQLKAAKIAAEAH